MPHQKTARNDGKYNGCVTAPCFTLGLCSCLDSTNSIHGTVITYADRHRWSKCKRIVGKASASSSIAPALLYLRASSATAPRQLLLGNCSCVTLIPYVLYICIVLLASIHGHMRYPNKLHPCNDALFSVSVPDSTLPIPSLESYYLSSMAVCVALPPSSL